MLAGFDVAANAARMWAEELAQLPVWAIRPDDHPVKVNAYYDAGAALQVREFRREVDNVMVFKQVLKGPDIDAPALIVPDPFERKYDAADMMRRMELDMLKVQLANVAIPPMYLQDPTRMALPDPIREPTKLSRIKLAESIIASLRSLPMVGGSGQAYGQYEQHLLGRGFKVVGSGMYSTALAKDGVVAKINRKPDSGDVWAQYCMDNYDTFQHLPKVYDVLRTGNRDGCAYITIMQQYEVYNNASGTGRAEIYRIKDSLEQYFDYGNEYAVKGKAWADMADDIRRTFRYGTRWDIHAGNFLWDSERGVAVLSDPYSYTDTKLPMKTHVLPDMRATPAHSLARALAKVQAEPKHHQHLLEAENIRQRRRVA